MLLLKSRRGLSPRERKTTSQTCPARRACHTCDDRRFDNELHGYPNISLPHILTVLHVTKRNETIQTVLLPQRRGEQERGRKRGSDERARERCERAIGAVVVMGATDERGRARMEATRARGETREREREEKER